MILIRRALVWERRGTEWTSVIVAVKIKIS
jgi:hypothetical protein